MTKLFHERPFDAATKIKLEIFQCYIREWLSIILTARKDGQKKFNRANIFDLFSGPGRDLSGVHGSPLIIQDEIKAYCRTRGAQKGDIPVRMVFNDHSEVYIAELQKTLQGKRCPQDCCTYEYHALPFVETLQKVLPSMQEEKEANLVILDQCGVSEVTPETVQTLVECGATDVLFFIASSFLRRFADTTEMQSKLETDPERLKIEKNDTVHRHIWRHFQDKLKKTRIELAPFSLKKGSNVYGLIFASAHLKALERFLAVCWKIDPHTGEANYNIDHDPTYGGQTSLFAEKPTKVDRFERELFRFVEEHAPDNRKLYRFCLRQGFPSAKANESLRRLQKDGRLRVLNAQDKSPARKNSFYLTSPPQTAIFRIEQP